MQDLILFLSLTVFIPFGKISILTGDFAAVDSRLPVGETIVLMKNNGEQLSINLLFLIFAMDDEINNFPLLIGDPTESKLFFGDFTGVEDDVFLLLATQLLGESGCAPCSLNLCGEATTPSSVESVSCSLSAVITVDSCGSLGLSSSTIYIYIHTYVTAVPLVLSDKFISLTVIFWRYVCRKH